MPDSSEKADAPDDLRPAYQRAYEVALEAAKKALGRRFRLVRLARNAYRKTVDEGDAVEEVKGDLLALVRLVRAWADGDYRQVSRKTLLSVVGAVLYFVFPLDAIPDFIPVVGYADDVAVVAAVVRSIRDDLDRFRQWEAEQRDRDPGSEGSTPPSSAGPEVTGDGAPRLLSS